jgi:hypothetical protein
VLIASKHKEKSKWDSHCITHCRANCISYFCKREDAHAETRGQEYGAQGDWKSRPRNHYPQLHCAKVFIRLFNSLVVSRIQRTLDHLCRSIRRTQQEILLNKQNGLAGQDRVWAQVGWELHYKMAYTSTKNNLENCQARDPSRTSPTTWLPNFRD